MSSPVPSSLETVLTEIRATCLSCGRNPQEVKIVAVSKLQSVSQIRQLYNQGQRIFAENYIQEVLAKQLDTQLEGLSLEWHLIGHIQRKKINSIVGRFSLIHSVDSLELAQSLSQKYAEQGKTQRVLLQVNVTGEKGKEGWAAESLRSQWQRLEGLPALQIEGLMTMPPIADEAEFARKPFRELRTLRDELQKTSGRHTLTELSMGTTQDYLIAVEEGSTYVRIGARLFGERQKK